MLTASWRLEHQLQLFDFGSGKLIEEVPWVTGLGESPCLLYAAQFSKGAGDYIAACGR